MQASRSEGCVHGFRGFAETFRLASAISQFS
jgi:hypothetical protein